MWIRKWGRGGPRESCKVTWEGIDRAGEVSLGSCSCWGQCCWLLVANENWVSAGRACASWLCFSVCLGQAAGYCPPSPLETNAGEIYFVELVKEDGTLGFSVTVRLFRELGKQ